MKVIKVAAAGDVERGVAAYASVADRLMFDAAEGTLPGGNAKAFDWTILSGRERAAAVAPGRRPHARTTSPRPCALPARARSTFPLASNAAAGVKSIDLIRAFLDRVKAL